MLRYLETRDVGPADHLQLDLAPRFNLLTGDNGLGKTFLLDIAWFMLTGTWTGPAVRVRQDRTDPRLCSRSSGQDRMRQSLFNSRSQFWEQPERIHPTPGVLIYVKVDGGFAVWDSARHATELSQGHPSAYHFNSRNLWDGLEIEDQVLCNGLIRDWVTWQYRKDDAFDTLTEVLAGLSPSGDEPLRPGAPARIRVKDAREIPTLEFPYESVPVTHASAGLRRILALAYLMVWAWSEHRATSKLIGEPAAKRLLILFDEVEAHLHPQWQRALLPSLLTVTKHLQADLDVQLMATTHAPLVLASAEPEFCATRDALFVFNLDGGNVTVDKVDWRPRGDASDWLTSEVFDLKEARSLPAERAIQGAMRAMRRPDLSIEDIRQIHRELHAVLKETDTFWPRWLATAKAAGIEP